MRTLLALALLGFLAGATGMSMRRINSPLPSFPGFSDPVPQDRDSGGWSGGDDEYGSYDYDDDENYNYDDDENYNYDDDENYNYDSEEYNDDEEDYNFDDEDYNFDDEDYNFDDEEYNDDDWEDDYGDEWEDDYDGEEHEDDYDHSEEYEDDYEHSDEIDYNGDDDFGPGAFDETIPHGSFDDGFDPTYRDEEGGDMLANDGMEMGKPDENDKTEFCRNKTEPMLALINETYHLMLELPPPDVDNTTCHWKNRTALVMEFVEKGMAMMEMGKKHRGHRPGGFRPRPHRPHPVQLPAMTPVGRVGVQEVESDNGDGNNRWGYHHGEMPPVDPVQMQQSIDNNPAFATAENNLTIIPGFSSKKSSQTGLSALFSSNKPAVSDVPAMNGVHRSGLSSLLSGGGFSNLFQNKNIFSDIFKSTKNSLNTGLMSGIAEPKKNGKKGKDKGSLPGGIWDDWDSQPKKDKKKNKGSLPGGIWDDWDPQPKKNKKKNKGGQAGGIWDDWHQKNQQKKKKNQSMNGNLYSHGVPQDRISDFAGLMRGERPATADSFTRGKGGQKLWKDAAGRFPGSTLQEVMRTGNAGVAERHSGGMGSSRFDFFGGRRK